MNIDKAIRRQKKSYKRFLLSMCFIFFALPAILVITKRFYLFYIIYLIVIEYLIIISIYIRTSKEMLSYEYHEDKLRIVLGISKKKINISCNKVLLVHVENISYSKDNVKDFKIILVASSKFRSDRMIPINLNFLKNHPYVAYLYSKIKALYPESDYYYTIIKRAGLNKYPLLDTIYKSCVYSHFTEEAIEKIKFYRENSEHY